MIFLYLFAGFAINYLLGCGVCAAIDDDNHSLFKWYCDAPFGIGWTVPTLWPVIAWFWLRRQR